MTTEQRVYLGPTTLPCPQDCAVPKGIALARATRRTKGDKFACLNGCGRAWVVVALDQVKVARLNGYGPPLWEQIADEGVR